MYKFNAEFVMVALVPLVLFSQLQAVGLENLQNNKWTMASGTCLLTAAFSKVLSFNYSRNEKEMLEKEVPEELARLEKEARPEVEKLVPLINKSYRKELFKINWLNFYHNLHSKNNKLSETLVASYYKRIACDWISFASAIAFCIALIPALQEQKIIE